MLGAGAGIAPISSSEEMIASVTVVSEALGAIIGNEERYRKKTEKRMN